MRKEDVVIGAIYGVKVSGFVVPVKVTGVHPLGGFIGVNQVTGRTIRIKTAGRLRISTGGRKPKRPYRDTSDYDV